MYKLITWDEDKNDILKKQRWVCFEDIKVIMESWNIVDLYEHHNKDKYPNQKIIIISFFYISMFF